MIKKIFNKYHEKWAKEKFDFFLKNMDLLNNQTILDMGGGDGSYMDRFKASLNNYKVIIADIDKTALKIAEEKGYFTSQIDAASNKLPFNDQEIDCVFCNSVIEHITIPKDQLWSDRSSSDSFFDEAFEIQKKFATELRRVAKKYYVQTPHKAFPVEAHTWFPFVGYLKRKNQLRVIKQLNKFWVKKTAPDWNLLDEHDMQKMFPDAEIIVWKKYGFKKEIIALKK